LSAGRGCGPVRARPLCSYRARRILRCRYVTAPRCLVLREQRMGAAEDRILAKALRVALERTWNRARRTPGAAACRTVRRELSSFLLAVLRPGASSAQLILVSTPRMTSCSSRGCDHGGARRGRNGKRRKQGAWTPRLERSLSRGASMRRQSGIRVVLALPCRRI
jgi:hypothetical protein